MCGIVALIATGDVPLDKSIGDVESSLDRSLDRIQHRGPDGRGIWVSDDRKIALAHCRLAINDLTVSGVQPLHSSTGIHAVVNGELYDYDHLHDLLSSKGYTFTSRSDSELVLYLYEEFGVEFTRYLRGEFAIALYDGREGKGETIVLRDRFGIKPMFVRHDRERAVMMVGAEMKAFLPLGWEPEWDVGAIADGGWGQDTRTIFKGVEKLRPGHYIRIKEGVVETKEYWDAEYPDKTQPETRSESDMISRTRELLVESVAHRLRADVPIGIYLSGGIDSSALAGIAAHLVEHKGLTMGKQDHSERICCFSIAFDLESGFDESDVSRRTAEHLGVKFITQHMNEKALADRFEEAVYSCEHHNHDLNFIGKHALSELPREHGYKVVLTGEGADEHFGGYPLYLPDYLSHGETGQEVRISQEERNTILREKIEETAASYRLIGADSTYFDKRTNKHLPIYTPSSMSAFTPPPSLFTEPAVSSIGTFSPLDVITKNASSAAQEAIKTKWHPLNSGMYIWSKGHLANQFLSCLGDRVEMAHSVEARTPFLDHVLAEHVNSLPVNLKIRSARVGQAEPSKGLQANGDPKHGGDIEFIEKYALREAVKPYVTEEVYKRRKHPYSAPTTYPYGGPVNTLLRKLLTQKRVEQLGFISWASVQNLLEKAWDGDVWAWRTVLIVAEWTVLSDRFAVKTWSG